MHKQCVPGSFLSAYEWGYQLTSWLCLSLSHAWQKCEMCYQELMNRHGKKERWTSVPILCQITLQNVPYKDLSYSCQRAFEVTTVTTMDSQKPTCCDDGHLLAS